MKKLVKKQVEKQLRIQKMDNMIKQLEFHLAIAPYVKSNNFA